MFQDLNQNNEPIEIRHVIDPDSGVLYLSIVDVIEMLGVSTDPRNYWKTLKSRLNKAQNKLVTNCNQLKMRASDGKMYQSDATDTETMLLIIQHIAPNKVTEFRKIFKQIETNLDSLRDNSPTIHEGLSTEADSDYELQVDCYEQNEAIFIRAMLASVDPSDISIITTCNSVCIKGERKPKNIDSAELIQQELTWGKFYREINLEHEIDIDATETSFSLGVLQIKLPVIDKSRTKILKIKS